MNLIATTVRSISIAALLNLTSCLDHDAVTQASALEAEILEIQRNIDLANDQIADDHKAQERALDRAKQHELERLEHLNSQADQRTEIEHIRAKTAQLQAEFQDYKNACVIGRLDLTDDRKSSPPPPGTPQDSNTE